MKITILYEDESLIAAAKPPGAPVHEAPGPGKSVLRLLREQLGGAELVAMHRLDRDVSGVLLLARSKEVARGMERAWSGVEKTYWALCAGAPAAENGVVDAPILEHQTGKPWRLKSALDRFTREHPGQTRPSAPAPKTSAVHPAGRPAQTAYRVLRVFGGAGAAPGPTGPTNVTSPGSPAQAGRSGVHLWSWLELSPRQGRMHQVRVHLAHLGCPLAVDPLYGGRGELRERDLRPGGGERVLLRRLSLHAARLVFPHPVEPDRRVTVEAPIPEDLAEALEFLSRPAQA